VQRATTGISNPQLTTLLHENLQPSGRIWTRVGRYEIYKAVLPAPKFSKLRIEMVTCRRVSDQQFASVISKFKEQEVILATAFEAMVVHISRINGDAVPGMIIEGPSGQGNGYPIKSNAPAEAHIRRSPSRKSVCEATVRTPEVY